MDTKDLLDLCKKAGFDIKNQLSSLEPEQRDQIVELARRGSSPPPAPPKAPPAVVDQRVRILDQPRRPRLATPSPAAPPETPAAATTPPPPAAPAAAEAPPAPAAT